jgi:hypothetical protein
VSYRQSLGLCGHSPPVGYEAAGDAEADAEADAEPEAAVLADGDADGDMLGLAEGISVGSRDLSGDVPGAVVAALQPDSSIASIITATAAKTKTFFIAPHLSQFGIHSISRYLSNIRFLLV